MRGARYSRAMCSVDGCRNLGVVSPHRDQACFEAFRAGPVDGQFSTVKPRSKLQNLFSGLSTACDFADLAQNGFCTRPVAHQRHDLAGLGPRYRARLGPIRARRPLCLGSISIHQTGSQARMRRRRDALPVGGAQTCRVGPCDSRASRAANCPDAEGPVRFAAAA